MGYISHNIAEFLQNNPELHRQILANNKGLLQEVAKKAGYELVPFGSINFLESKPWTGHDDEEDGDYGENDGE